ncbi:MAG: hypothetical protein IJF54_06120 [Clostridia bacterium]|nr:hypothetical protein [Clostridia bacterium]
MDNQVKVCQKCNTINEWSADFCRVCGEKLSEPDVVNQQQTHQQQQYNSQPNLNPNEVCGIPAEEVALFVGEKANKFVPKFVNYSMTGKKAGFNVLVFLLGFLINPIVAAFWFFHRRMNKLGTIILAVSVLLFAANTVCLMPTVEGIMDIAEVVITSENFEVIESIEDPKDMFEYFNDEEMDKIFEAVEKVDSVSTLSSLVRYASVAFTIIIAIFANWWYMQFCVNKIRKVKENPEYTPNDIMAAGGTKSVVWVLLLVAYIIANMAIVVNVIGQFMELVIKAMEIVA